MKTVQMMCPGSVIRLRTFRHYTGGRLGIQTMDYSAPTGKVFLAILVGSEDREEGGQTLDPIWCLNDLGWYSGMQLTDFFGSERMKEFGECVDASRGR